MRITYTRASAFLIFLLCTLSTTLISFSKPGGDLFEIYLNKKLILQQFVGQTAQVKSFDLDPGDLQGQIEVSYTHCGQVGKSRRIVIQDGKTVLKQWYFKSADRFMSVSARDILSLQKKRGDGRVELYYFSEQLPAGKILATITLNTGAPNKVTP